MLILKMDTHVRIWTWYIASMIIAKWTWCMREGKRAYSVLCKSSFSTCDKKIAAIKSLKIFNHATRGHG